jgi:hypothetical protein
MCNYAMAEVCETITCNMKVRYAKGIFNTPRDARTFKSPSGETAIVFVVMKLLILQVHHASVTLPIHLYKRCGLKREGGASSRLHVLIL